MAIHLCAGVLLLSFGVVAGDFILTVLHTNDVHARFEQFTSTGPVCTEADAQAGVCFGGIARRATAINTVKNSPIDPNVILLDAGDQFQGTEWFFTHKGLATSHFMNRLGYDAMALGTHEFDRKVEGLVPFLRNVTFPVLSSNIDVSEEPDMAGLFSKSTVISIGGDRIGIIGYTSDYTATISNPGKVKFLDIVDSVRAEADSLTSQGVNKLIALGHAGLDTDKLIAASVPGIDVVVGGLSSTFLYNGISPSGNVQEGPYPLVVDRDDGSRAVIVQDYLFGKYLGYLKVVFDDMGVVKGMKGNPIFLDNNIVEDAGILAEMAEWRQPLEDAKTEVIAQSVVNLDGTRQSCWSQECNMGNMITDGMIHQHLDYTDNSYWADVSLAIAGAGAIRSSISKGSLTKSDVQKVLPFGNTIDLVELEGRHLQEVFEYAVETSTGKQPGKFLQVSGIRVTYNMSKPNGHKVVSMEVRCANCLIPRFEPLNPDANYKFLTTDFLVRGGDGFNVVSENMINHQVFGDIDSELLVNYVKAVSPITHGIEGRIQIVGDSTDVVDKEKILGKGVQEIGSGSISTRSMAMSWTIVFTVCVWIKIS